MEAPQPVEPQPALPLGPDRLEVPTQVVAGREEVAGVGTVAHPVPHITADQVAKLGQLLEPRSQRRPAPRRGLEQHAHAVHRPEAFGVPRRVATHARITVVEVVARVRHEVADSQGPAPAQFAGKSRCGSFT